MKRYVPFFLLALALGIAPGPDILFVFAQGLGQGAAAGSVVTCGLWNRWGQSRMPLT